VKITRLFVALAACAVPAFAGYTYDYANLLNPYNSSQWAFNGTGSASTGMFTSSNTTTGAAIIFTGGSLPSPSNGYEVRTTLTLTSSGGNYFTYLHATNPSGLGSGAFYDIEIANPTFSGSSCSATLNIFKQSGPGSISNVYSAGIPCHNGMVVRAVILSTNVVAVYIDNFFYTSWGWGDSSPITSGAPGVGVAGAPSGNGISTIDIGHQDTVAPNPINSSAIGATAFPNHVDFQFPGTTDDANGTGIAYYQWWRCTGTS
jgi:hypothetical protein